MYKSQFKETRSTPARMAGTLTPEGTNARHTTAVQFGNAALTLLQRLATEAFVAVAAHLLRAAPPTLLFAWER